MISDTQKEIWTREAAVKVCHPDKPKDIAECVDSVTDGVKWLLDNPNAQKLAYNVIDVVMEKIEIRINEYYKSFDDLYSQAFIEDLAEMLHIELPTKKVGNINDNQEIIKKEE